MWPSDGSYLKKSTLKALEKYIGNYDVEASDFNEGLFSRLEVGGLGKRDSSRCSQFAEKAGAGMWQRHAESDSEGTSA